MSTHVTDIQMHKIISCNTNRYVRHYISNTCVFHTSHRCSPIISPKRPATGTQWGGEHLQGHRRHARHGPRIEWQLLGGQRSIAGELRWQKCTSTYTSKSIAMSMWWLNGKTAKFRIFNGSRLSRHCYPPKEPLVFWGPSQATLPFMRSSNDFVATWNLDNYLISHDIHDNLWILKSHLWHLDRFYSDWVGNTWGIDPSTLGWTSLGRCKDIFQVATSQLIDAGQSDLKMQWWVKIEIIGWRGWC